MEVYLVVLQLLLADQSCIFILEVGRLEPKPYFQVKFWWNVREQIS
jgi:hypothetical protein